MRPMRGVGLVGADDLVAHLLAVGGAEPDRRPEGDPRALLRRLDDLGPAQLGLELPDPPLDEPLPLLGGVILGVLGEVPVGARLGDGLDDAAAAPRASAARAPAGGGRALLGSSGSVASWIVSLARGCVGGAGGRRPSGHCTTPWYNERHAPVAPTTPARPRLRPPRACRRRACLLGAPARRAAPGRSRARPARRRAAPPRPSPRPSASRPPSSRAARSSGASTPSGASSRGRRPSPARSSRARSSGSTSDLGDAVREGQPLADLDRREADLTIDQLAGGSQRGARENLARARAAADASRANLERVRDSRRALAADVERARADAEWKRRELERTQELRAKDLIAARDVDQARAQSQAADALVQMAETSLGQHGDQLRSAEAQLEADLGAVKAARGAGPPAGGGRRARAEAPHRHGRPGPAHGGRGQAPRLRRASSSRTTPRSSRWSPPTR